MEANVAAKAFYDPLIFVFLRAYDFSTNGVPDAQCDGRSFYSIRASPNGLPGPGSDPDRRVPNDHGTHVDNNSENSLGRRNSHNSPHNTYKDTRHKPPQRLLRTVPRNR